MSDFTLRDRDDKPIEDWRQWTRPKESYQWKAGRSAMELARAWFTSRQPQYPLEVEGLLATHFHLMDFQVLEGCSELVTSLPESGEGRNHDLWLRAKYQDQGITLCFEAKADEPFGNESIGQYWTRKKNGSKPTRAPQRIEKLLEIVFGADACPQKLPWSGLRYQLLTGVAGTLLQSVRDKSEIGLFIIHEFHTESVDPEKLKANNADYLHFMNALYDLPGNSIREGQVYGPRIYTREDLKVTDETAEQGRINLYLGKCHFDWDA